MNTAFRNRYYRRREQSVLRGKETTITLDISPKMPQSAIFPVGTQFSTTSGNKVETIEETIVKPKWWWKYAARFLRKWRPKVILKVRFV